jgi:hypothetical protein
MHRRLAAVLLFLAATTTTNARVKIRVAVTSIPGWTGPAKIQAIVDNNNAEPITICVDVGVGSLSDQDRDKIEATPHPFVVKSEAEDSWETLLGWDVGKSYQPQVLQGRETLKFIFRPSQGGTLRLVLYYWQGSAPSIDCTGKRKGSRKAKSQPFSAGPFYVLH